MQFVCLSTSWKQLQTRCAQLHVTVHVCVPRRCSLGHVSNSQSSDTMSLPGFENLTMGYNKYLRPYFGGMLAPRI